MRFSLTLVVAAGCADATSFGPLEAPGVIDQSYVFDPRATGAMGANINEGKRFIAQTFTAGVDGLLTHVAIDVFAIERVGIPDVGLHIAIRDVVDGTPTTTRTETLLPTPGSPAWLWVALDSFEQLPGNVYAIVVDYPDAPPPGAGQARGNWMGQTGLPYPRGGLLASDDGVHWTTLLDDGAAFFETWVEPVILE